MIVFAIEQLFAAVVAQFAADVTPALNLFGWRTPAQKVMPGGAPLGDRILWIPGDDETGEIGEMGPAKLRATEPRSLGTLGELFTVRIYAADETLVLKENELAQYRACRALYDAWFRAVYLAAHGTFTVQSVEWVIDQKERRHGASIRVLLQLDAMIPDFANPDANELNDLAADIATTLLDVTETDHFAGDGTT